LELGALLPVVDYIRAHQFRTRFLVEFIQALREADVIVSSTVAVEAHLEGFDYQATANQ